MPGTLNRGQIVYDGLQLGGNPGLAKLITGSTDSLATRMLNMVLAHMYRAKQWSWLKKATTVQADATDTSLIAAASLPATYKALVNLRPQNVKFNGRGLMQINDYNDYLAMRRVAEENGSPTAVSPTSFSIDEGSRTSTEERPNIYLYPKPSTRLTLDLSYQSLPAALTSDTQFPDFPDSLVLVNMLASWCKDFQRDQTLPTVLALANQAIAEYAASHQDKGRQTNIQVEFDETYYPPWGGSD